MCTRGRSVCSERQGRERDRCWNDGQAGEARGSGQHDMRAMQHLLRVVWWCGEGECVGVDCIWMCGKECVC